MDRAKPKKHKTHKTLEERMSEYKGDYKYEYEEWDTGVPRGREVW